MKAKHLAAAGTALALAGLLAWGVARQVAPTGPASPGGRGPGGRPPVAVTVAPVETGDIREVGRLTGTLRARAEFVVAPKVAGRLERLPVRIGDRVAPGQLVAVLDDDEYRQEAEQAAAELEVARATIQEREHTLASARREHERAVLLREKKIASAAELDAAEAELRSQEARLKVAVAQLAQKEAALAAARLRLANAEVRLPDPMPGAWVVGERFVDAGALLAPNQPIVSVLDIAGLVAVVHVVERDYPKIRPGLAADVRAEAHRGRGFPGSVARVAPLVLEESREARVEIEVPNPEGLLRPGMFVEAVIELARRPGATLVPAAALVKRDGAAGVFLADLEAGTAAFVPVETGIAEGDRVEVVAPPLAGSVVTLGQHLLEDGARIAVAKPAAAAP